MDISRHALLKDLPKQVALFEETYRKQDINRSLQIGERLLSLYPDSHLGYYCCAKAYRGLGNMQKALSMIEKAVSSLPGGELELYVLLEANNIYRDIGIFETAAIFSYKAKQSFPGEYSGYLRFAQDLRALGMNQLAVHVINEGTSLFPDITAMHIVADKIRLGMSAASAEHIDKHESTSSEHRLPVSIAIAGNCQVAPLRLFLEQSISHVHELTPYQRITDQKTIDDWLRQLPSCDAVAMIPVKNGYNKFDFGSDLIKDYCLKQGVMFFTYPSFHLETFFPFFWNARTSSGQRWTIQNIHGDYHDYLAMRLSLECSDYVETFFRILYSLPASSAANQIIVDIAVSSLSEYRNRYPEYWHILESDIALGLGYTYNHPTLQFLNSLYNHIWQIHLGLPSDQFRPLVKETMKAHVLPIPRFVVNALTSCHSPQLLRDLFVNKSIDQFVQTTNSEYLCNASEYIAVYRSSIDDVMFNTGSPKFILADAFVDRVMNKS